MASGYLSIFDQFKTQAPPAYTDQQGQPSSGYASIFDQFKDDPQPAIEEKPESGFLAHLKKSFADAYDYINLTGLGADGAEGNEEEIARIVAEKSRREQEVVKSAQHQYLLDVIGRESKDVKDAEGFANTSLAVLGAAGKSVWAAITNPLGVAEFGASQAGNMAVAVGGMFTGAAIGSLAGPIGTVIGGRTGALGGGTAVETGAAYIEALMKAGIDVTNEEEVRKAISDPEFQREMYRKGLTKGVTIGAVDAAFMGLSKIPGTKAGRELHKDLLKEGIDIKKSADWEKIAIRNAEGDEAITAAFKKYADTPRAKAVGTKKMAIETIGEGVGEGLGGLAAFGETSFEDIALEMLGSTAQSAVQASVSASLSGSKALLQKATKESLRQQAEAVNKGKASGIEPKELNDALLRQKDGIGALLNSTSASISAFEDEIGNADSADSVADTLRTALTLQDFAQYTRSLQSALQQEENYPNGVIPLFVALTKEDQATLAAGGSLNRPLKGSLGRNHVKTLKGRTNKKGENFGGQDVVLVKVPVASVIMRGNWDQVELVVDSKGVQLAAVPQVKTKQDAKPVLATKLEQEADALARQDADAQLQREVEIGELESQATDRPKKEVETDVREAQNKAARKLAQLREEENYENVGTLQAALDRNKIPVFPGQRRKRPPLALALQNYRKALQKPDSAASVNDVLAPTGYKVIKQKDGVYIVPIDDKPALRVPNTGNREVGQSTVDDYLFWINEEKTQKKTETTENKQKSLRKEAAQVEARKPPRENVQTIIASIESNFVTRKGGKVTIDEDGLSDILAQTENITGWSKTDISRLNQYVKSVRREQELGTKSKKAPVKGTTITVPQSAGALTSLESSFKRTGKSKFIERVRKLLTNKKGNDALLEQIAKAYRKANPGKAEGDIASILTLTGKADQADIAKVYALAQILITLRPSVSTIRPDNSLAIEDGNLSAFMRFDKVLGGVQENQLVGQIKQAFGEDATYTRINDFEVVVTNPKLTPIQFARRFGRLRGKRNDIRKSELFTAQIETHTHDWAKDTTGESIRGEIRRLGFGSILQYVDDRRADYLDIAEEFGAKEVAQYRQAPRAPPQETTAEETEAADEAAFSLADTTKVYPGEYELTASDGTKYKVVQAEAEETFGPGREWKLYRATKENPDYHADFDWDWMDTFPRLKDAKAWVDDQSVARKVPADSVKPKVTGTDKVGRPIYDWRGATVFHFTDTESAADIKERGYQIVGDGYYGEAVSFTINAEYGKQFSDFASEGEGGVQTFATVASDANIINNDDPILGQVLGDRNLVPIKYKNQPKRKSWREKFIELGVDGVYDPGAGDLFIYNLDKISYVDATTLAKGQEAPLFSLEKLTAAQKMQSWIDSKVAPIVETLAEDSENIRFRLPKDLSNAQKEKYKTAVGKFFTRGNVTLGKDSVIASFPLPVTDNLQKSRAKKLSTVRILTGREKPVIEGTGKNGKIRKFDLGVFLQERTRAQGRIAIGDYSDAAKAQFVASMLEEVRYQLSQSDNAIGWYEEKVSNMMEVLGVIYPELNTDKNNEMVMKAFLAITSQGTEVDENIRNAVAQYEHYRNTGEIRIWGTGKSIKAIKLNHQALAKMIASTGLDQTTEFLETPFTVKQLDERGFEVSGELMSYEGRGALIFGPKIGSFFGNLYGHYESLTADLWFSRTWNRISGNLLTSANVSKLNSTKQELSTLLKNARLVKPHLNGYKRQDLLKDEALRLEWAASVHGAWARGGYKNKSDELRTIKRFDEIHNQLEDAPRNGEERGFMRSVIKGVKDALKKDGTDITTADIQAVLWYHEKDLYAKLGVGDSKSEATDYEQAARRLLAEKRPDLGFDHVLRGSRTTDRTGRTTQRQGDSGRKPGRTKRDAEDVEAQSLIPIDKPASGGFSASGLRQALVSRFGAKGIARLEADGILVIVESAADLPVGLIKDQDAAQRARGLFDPKTNTAYLVANRLNGITAPKVLLHEVGTHFGLKRMIGNEAYANLIIELEAGKDTIFKPWYDRIRADYSGRVNEGTDRFAEEVLAAIAEDTSEITLPLRTRIWRAVKEFLFGTGLPRNLTPQEIGYVIQGSLRKALRQNDLALAKLPRFMGMEGGDAQLGSAAIAFPEYTPPTRALTQEHRRYDIISAVDKVLTRSEELRLRRNMDGMMKVAERVYKKGYKNIDVHLPVVSPTTSITSRYAMFKNTQTGTELVIRMSDHAKDPFVAAGSFPFVSYNNGHKMDMVDLTDIERAVKLLSTGKLDGMNGLEFQFEHSFGDGVAGVSKANSQKFTYQQFLKALQKKNPSMFARVQDNAQMELRSGAVIGEEGPVFALNPNSGLDAESQAAINKTKGDNARRSAGEIVSDARNRWWQRTVQYWVDAYRPVKNLLGDQATRAWQMMQLSENAHGMLHAMLHYGSPKASYRNGQFDWYDVDFSNDGLLDILKDLDGEADRFMAWMVYTRANRLNKEEREKNFTEDEITTGLQLNQHKSEKDRMTSGRDRRVVYQKAMRKMSKLQDSVLQMALDAGVISEEVREDLKTDFYVPFYREFTSDGKTSVKSPTPAHDFVNIKSVVTRLRGSEENIHDALHNMMMNWTTIMSAAMKNRAGVAAMDAAVNAGAATLLTSKKDIASIEFSKGKSRNEKFDSFVYVLKDGKKVWYEVNDALVLNAMSSLAWGGVDSKALRTLSTFKRWLTIGVTASPAFKIRNMIRDTVHSIAVGKLSYNAFGNATKGYEALKNDNLVTARMMMGGGTFQFGFFNDDPAAIRRMVDAVGEGRIINTTAKARKVLGGLFGWYQDIGNRMENANRASLYMQRVEEVGHLAASHESRDLMNFSSHGRGVAAQWLMASLPFANARLQGLSKLARSGAKGERARLLTVVGTVTLASILLRLSYEGDEDYEELEEWQKDTYWPIKVPGTKDFFFIPKPFEIGAIASVGDRITENFIRDIGGGSGISKYTQLRIMELITHQLAMDWRPQIVKPVVELWQNKNAFTGRQIENLTWQLNEIPNELRVRAYTSDFAIKTSWAMGEILDVMPDMFGKLKKPDFYPSPVQVDHLIKGYFGWLGATTTGSFDILTDAIREEVSPLSRLDEMRGLVPAGSFFSGSPRKTTKYLTLFYEQLGEVKSLKASYDAYKRRRMADEARAVVDDNRDVMRWLKTYNRANKSIQKINKRIGFIYDDKKMTPAEKRTELDRLNELKVGIAKKIVLIRAEREDEEGVDSMNPLGSLRSN
jgi:hypothetical protein